MTINCIAIDDEPLALNVIEHLTQKIPFLNLKNTFTNAFDALEYLNKERIDLIFLDIQMPELTGFEFIRTLNNKPLVIFTTAYPSHALESYELDAVDYLLKPIPFERFLKAVNKVQNRLKDSTEHVENSITQTKEFIFVKTEYKTIKIFLDEILYIESQKDYVIFYTGTDKILSLNSIKSVENFLPSDKFIRVHRSFIISPEKIEAIERNNISIGKHSIPIGDNYKDLFKNFIEKKRL